MEAVVLLDVSGFISSQVCGKRRAAALNAAIASVLRVLVSYNQGRRGAWGFRLFDGRSCGLGRTPLELSRLLKSLKLPYRVVARGSFSCLDANSAVDFAKAVLQAARALRKDPSQTDRDRAIRRWVKDGGDSPGMEALKCLYGGHDMSSKGLLLRSVAECVIEFEHSKEERGNQTKGQHQVLQRSILIIATPCPKSDEEWQSYNNEGDFINIESVREKITRENCREEEGIRSSDLTSSSGLENGLTSVTDVDGYECPLKYQADPETSEIDIVSSPYVYSTRRRRLVPILLKRHVEIICIDCQFNFRQDVVQAFRDSLRLVDARLLDWRELGLGPWLLPIWDKRHQRESSENQLLLGEENAEEHEPLTVKMPWGFETLKLISVPKTRNSLSLKHKMFNAKLTGCMELRSVDAAAGGMGSDGSFLAHSNTPGWRTLLLTLCRRGACAILRSENENEKVASFDTVASPMTNPLFATVTPSKVVEMSPTQPKTSKQLPVACAALPKLLEGVLGWVFHKGSSTDDNSDRAVPNKAMNHERSTSKEGTAPPSFGSPVITPEEPRKVPEFWLLVPLTLSCASLRKIPKVWIGEQGLEELPPKPWEFPHVFQQPTVCRTTTPGVSRAGEWDLLQEYFAPDKLKASNFLSVPHNIDDNTPAGLLLPGGGVLQAESIAAVAATQRIVGLGEEGEREEAAKAVADVQGISLGGGGRLRGRRVKYDVNTASSSGNRLHSPCSVLAFGKSESRDNKNSVNEGGSGMPCNSNDGCSVYDVPTTPLPLLLGWLHTPFALGAMAIQDPKGFLGEDSQDAEKWDALRVQLDQASDEYVEALKIGEGVMANREKHKIDHVITEKKETETTHSGREPSSRLDEDNPKKRVCLQQVYDECLAIGEQGGDEDGLDYFLSKVNWLSGCDVAHAEGLILSVKALGRRHASMHSKATAVDRTERNRMRLKKVREYQLQALLRLEVSSRREGQDPIRSKDISRLKQILETLALDSASATAISLVTGPTAMSERKTPFSTFMEEVVKRYSSSLPNTLSQVCSEFEVPLPEPFPRILQEGEIPPVVEGAVGIFNNNPDRSDALSVENDSLDSYSTSCESSSMNKHTVCSSSSGSGGGGVLGKHSLLQRSLSGRFSQQRPAGGPKLCRVPSSLSGTTTGKKSKKQKKLLVSTPVKLSRDNYQTAAPRTPCSFSTMLFVNESPMDDEVKQQIGGHSSSPLPFQSSKHEESRATPRQKRVQRSVPETPV